MYETEYCVQIDISNLDSEREKLQYTLNSEEGGEYYIYRNQNSFVFRLFWIFLEFNALAHIHTTFVAELKSRQLKMFGLKR